MNTPIKIFGRDWSWGFVIPWLPFGFAILLPFVMLTKYPMSVDRETIEAAGQDWDNFPITWATSLDYTNEIPEHFVDSVPTVAFSDMEHLSNYLATVHLYRYEWSTNCIDWHKSGEMWNDDGEVRGALNRLRDISMQPVFTNPQPAMILWRATVVTNDLWY